MKTALLAAIAISCAAPALAGDAYVGASLGRGKPEGSVGNYSIVGDDYSTSYKLYGGYQFTPTFGLEGGFADLGKVDVYSANIGHFGSTRPQLFYAAATATLPVTDALSLHAKLGAAVTHTRFSIPADGGTFVATRDRNSMLLGVGASYAINEKVSLVAEYEDFGRIANGSGSSLKSNLLSAGVRLKF